MLTVVRRLGMEDQEEKIAAVARAFTGDNLTLYLGAGVSVGNGLPNWSKLVLAMYFTALEGDWKYSWRPFTNYLYAIAEWQLEHRYESPEITAQKIYQFYKDREVFFDDLRASLYAGGNFDDATGETLRSANPVLNSIANFCKQTKHNKCGIQAIVTYNYDSLVEAVTSESLFVPQWKSSSTPLDGTKRPIFHVHGYIPFASNQERSALDDILFTEEQYHGAANDPYSWSNLCQIQCLSSTVGLMIGLAG